MSVPKSQRSMSKLEAILAAKKLCEYTLQITANRNVFTEKYDALVKSINDTVQKIYINAFSANNIYVHDKISCLKRIDLQSNSILCCDELLALMDLAYSVFHLRMKRVDYWCSLVVNAKQLLKSWRKSDKERNKNYIKE